MKPLALVGWLLLYALLALLPMGLALGIERPPPRSFLVESGAMLGLLGLGMLTMQLVISGHHRWFAARVGQDNLLQFHRSTGLCAWLLVLSHPVLLMLGDADFLRWLDPREGWMRTGSLLVLVFALTAVVITSLWREVLGLRYETWRTLHFLLALLVVAGGLGHALLGAHHTAGTITQLGLIFFVGVALLLALHVRILRPWRLLAQPWRVVEVEERRADCTRLVLQADGHAGMAFRAGQFAWLSLATPFSLQQHPYSMSSGPGESQRVEFIVKASGDFGRALAKLGVGTLAYLDGPYGVFSLPRDTARATVFIAGGIGITPVLCMLRDCRERGHQGRLWLLYANESEADIVMREAVETLSDELSVCLVHVLSKPSDDWQGESGFIDAELLDRHLPKDTTQTDYFLCGPPAMLDKVEPALRARGAHPLRIRCERFDIV